MVLLANKLIDLALLANVLRHSGLQISHHFWVMLLIHITDQIRVSDISSGHATGGSKLELVLKSAEQA